MFSFDRLLVCGSLNRIKHHRAQFFIRLKCLCLCSYRFILRGTKVEIVEFRDHLLDVLLSIKSGLSRDLNVNDFVNSSSVVNVVAEVRATELK